MKKSLLSLLLALIMVASMVGAVAEAPLEKVTVSIAATTNDTYTPWSQIGLVQEMVDESADYLEIDWIDWATSVAAEKKNLALNGNNYPEVLLGSWLLNINEVSNYASQGILVPLEDYITPEIMPNLYEVFEARPEYRKELTATDGHIYGLPSYNEATAQLRSINDTILINTDWLKAVNKEMPTTTEELYEVLKAFDEAGDLNGNGIDDEIPMSFFYGTLAYGDHQYGMHSLLGWFGVCSNKQGITMKDGEVVFPGVQPEFKEAVKYFNRLYSEGLIDQEVFTQSKATYTAKVKSDPALIGALVYWSSYTPNMGGGTYEYMPPLTSPTGRAPVVQYRDFPLADNMAVWVTDKAQGKLDQIMRFVDKFYDQDRGVELSLGKMDVHMEETSENTFLRTSDEAGKYYSDEVKSVYSPLKYSPFLLLKENYIAAEISEGDQAGIAAMEVYKDYIEPAYSGYQNYWLTGEESQELSILGADIGDYYKQHLARWIVKGGVDEEWDAYVKVFEGLQLDRIIDIMTLDK